MTTRRGQNVCRVGEPGSGKSKATAASIVASHDAEIAITPHGDDLSSEILPHLAGNVLYAKLSDLDHAIGFETLRSGESDQENHRRAEAFANILVRRRGGDGLAATPLLEEWIMAAVSLFLFQSKAKPIRTLPFAFLPNTEEFSDLVEDCTQKEVAAKFRQLAKLSTRALRSEVGSAARLVDGVFRSPTFVAWSRGGFDLGAFLDHRGKLIVEQGDDIGHDTMRTIMATIILLAIDHAKRRDKDTPTVRVRIDEAANAGLLTNVELRAAAEHNKKGLYFEFNLQRLDVPCGPDDLLQLCHRHEWYRLSEYGLARKAAVDVLAGLPPCRDEPRASRIESLTAELMNLRPGERYVRDRTGARKEYVPLLRNPWPDWPGLRAAKFQEKLRWIHSRPEFLPRVAPKSPTGSASETRRPSKSPDASSPAARLKRLERKPADG